MLIKDVMHAHCECCDSDDDVILIARMMARNGYGVVPVAKEKKLVGMVTDRDIVVRGLAVYDEFANVTAKEIMSDHVYYFFDDQHCSEVAENMAELQVRRMPVVSRGKELVGFVSLNDFARSGEMPAAVDALEGVSKD